MKFSHRPWKTVNRKVCILAFSHIWIASVFEERELIILGEAAHDGFRLFRYLPLWSDWILPETFQKFGFLKVHHLVVGLEVWDDLIVCHLAERAFGNALEHGSFLQTQNLLWDVNHVFDFLQLLFQSVHHLSEQGGSVRFLFCFTHSRYFINEFVVLSIWVAPDSICQCKVNAKRIRKQIRNLRFNNLFRDKKYHIVQSCLSFKCSRLRAFPVIWLSDRMPDDYLKYPVQNKGI